MWRGVGRRAQLRGQLTEGPAQVSAVWGRGVAVRAVFAWTGRGSRGREFEVWGSLGNASRNGVRGAGVQGQELPAGREPSESEGALT